MTANALLSRLRSLDIKIWAENGELCCNAPKGALTAEVRTALNAHKAEILVMLSQASALRQEAPLRRLSRDGDVPLSFAQQRLWFIDQLEPGSALYNVPTAWRIRGKMRVALLQQCFNEIVQRHEVLRTRFKALDGRPVQEIAPAVMVTLPLVDLTDRREAEREDEALRLISEEARRPFDLVTGPLLRVLLVRLTAEDHVVLVTLHHIVSDGWSMGILCRELSMLYNAKCNSRAPYLEDLPVQYGDFAQWQREWLQERVLESQVTYWKERLANLPKLQLPTDRPRAALPSHRGERRSIVLANSLCEALKVLSQNEQVSLFMTLLAAFNILLSRYSGQYDIAIGTAIAGRNRVEIEPLIGFFVNTLVLRTDLAGDPTFRELLSRVRDTALDAYAHQDLPFEKLVEEMSPERNLAYAPLSQVMFGFQNFPESALEMSGCFAQPMDVNSGTAKFDLSCQMSRESYGIRCRLEYATDLFVPETIARMLGHFQRLLEAIVANPGQRISELEILTEAERHQLLSEWNDTQTEYPRDKSIPELFEEQVEETPDRIAVVFEGQQLTYRQLNQRANQVAHHLRSRGAGPDVLVGLCIERSLEMVIGLLGILKAGGAYVPLDPAYPPERLQFLLEDSRPKILLARRPLAERLLRFEVDVVYLDAHCEGFDQVNMTNPAGERLGESSAYVIYTSGSTGRPKGVMVEHRQLLNYTNDITRRLNIEGGCSFAMVQPLMFDSTVTVLFSSLLTGGSLHIVSKERSADPDALATYFQRYPIDVLKITPSHLAALQAFSRPEQFMPRRCLVIGGEESRWEWVQSLRTIAPKCEIINHYGPTETTVGVLTCRVADIVNRSDMSKTPLGHPLANTRTFILDCWLKAVPVGIPGELYIGGDNVTRGYLKQPALTAERFVPDPFSGKPGSRLYKTGDRARYLSDGNIEFLGRADHQIKIRGYRVEPGEIEAVLKEHPDVREAVVLARDDGGSEKRLIGYVVPTPGGAPTIGDKPRYKLPNGMAVAQLNKNETDYLYQEIFERQAYLKHGISIKDGDCIVDVGANIGLFTLFADEIAANLKIYSFEPNPAVFDILRANASLCKAEVNLFNYGLSDVPGTATFTFFPGFSLLSGFYADAHREKEVVKTYMVNQSKSGLTEMGELLGEAEQILDERFGAQNFTAPLDTLSAIIEAEEIDSIDLLKINVEKSELDVLNGIKDSDWSKIKQIVLEVDSEEAVSMIASMLEHYGFEFVVEQDDILAGTSLRYIYAVRPSKGRALVRDQQDRAHLLPISMGSPAFLSAAEIRDFLAKKLPEHMVPSFYVLLDSLPLNTNGKIDRIALAKIETVSQELDEACMPPRTATEKRVGEIWSEVLKLGEIGAQDNFFELGGHSLLAMRVISRLREAFSIDLPLRHLFESPTVAGLAQRIETIIWMTETRGEASEDTEEFRL
jgi:amino acid adenylation domain-containing protein/FkbM family methyltransferase